MVRATCSRPLPGGPTITTRDLPAITVFEGRWDGPTAILTQLNLAWQAAFEAIGAEAPARPAPAEVDAAVAEEIDFSAFYCRTVTQSLNDRLALGDRHGGAGLLENI